MAFGSPTGGPPSPAFPQHQVDPPPPKVKKRRWYSGPYGAKGITNAVVGVAWLLFLFSLGFLLNVYVLWGVNFPDGNLQNIWTAAGLATIYGSAVVAPLAGQWLISRKDVGWLGLVLLWSLPIAIQIAWVLAMNWAGGRYGFLS